jgi:DNA invertase Pin-like site-specific DNA recombinase
VSVDEPILDATAAGRLSANMIGAMNQFFSDSLSERIRYRMRAGFEAGRYLRARADWVHECREGSRA